MPNQMTILSCITISVILVVIIFPPIADTLGSVSTFTISYGTSTICGILLGKTMQRIECYRRGEIISLEPQENFEVISGGRNIVCGLKSGGLTLICWDTNSDLQPKTIYDNATLRLRDLAVGDDHFCAIVDETGSAQCWSGDGNMFPSPQTSEQFLSITSGIGFSCGILKSTKKVNCWGSNTISGEIQSQFGDVSMFSLVAGDSHVCGININGLIICKGKNDFGQLNAPSGSPFEFYGLALGLKHSCAVSENSGLVVCWGGSEFFFNNKSKAELDSFESIVAGLEFTCGLLDNFTLICWGPGWSSNPPSPPLPNIIVGPCVKLSTCPCGSYPGSSFDCVGSDDVICDRCRTPPPSTQQLPQQTLAPPLLTLKV